MTRPYVICRCRMCRSMGGPATRRWFKSKAHRLYRRKWRSALRQDEDGPVFIDMGYVA